MIFTCQYRHSLTVNISVAYNIVCETMSALNVYYCFSFLCHFSHFSLLAFAAAAAALCSSVTVAAVAAVSIPPAFLLFRFWFLSSSFHFFIQSMGCFLFLAFVFSSVSALFSFLNFSFLFFSRTKYYGNCKRKHPQCLWSIYFCLGSIVQQTSHPQIDSCLSMDIARSVCVCMVKRKWLLANLKCVPKMHWMSIFAIRVFYDHQTRCIYRYSHTHTHTNIYIYIYINMIDGHTLNKIEWNENKMSVCNT